MLPSRLKSVGKKFTALMPPLMLIAELEEFAFQNQQRTATNVFAAKPYGSSARSNWANNMRASSSPRWSLRTRRETGAG